MFQFKPAHRLHKASLEGRNANSGVLHLLISTELSGVFCLVQAAMSQARIDGLKAKSVLPAVYGPLSRLHRSQSCHKNCCNSPFPGFPGRLHFGKDAEDDRSREVPRLGTVSKRVSQFLQSRNTCSHPPPEVSGIKGPEKPREECQAGYIHRAAGAAAFSLSGSVSAPGKAVVSVLLPARPRWLLSEGVTSPTFGPYTSSGGVGHVRLFPETE